MKPDLDQMPTARIAVCEDPSSALDADIVAAYRDNVAKNAISLAAHGFKVCPPRIHDLCLVVASVSFADKAVARRRHIWRRRLSVTMPVYDLDFWTRPSTQLALTSLLSPLTGDDWGFCFVKRSDAAPHIAQTALSIRREGLKILPYSHGLDSFALRALEMGGSANRSLILLTSGVSPPGFAEFKARHGSKRIEHLRLPLHTKLESRRKNREPSYRSRAFVFGVAAGIAAYFSDTSHILCAEAGQGSLGPWLDPVGTEAPDIRTHPVFHRRLEAFIQLVLGHTVLFEQPRLWDTKGIALRMVVEQKLHQSWETTFSCSDRRTFTVLAHNRVNCGACPACFLRRVSLRAAGLDERQEEYLWSDLTASNFAMTAHPQGRVSNGNDESQATAGVAAMQRFADRALGDVTAASPVSLSALALATNLSDTDAAQKFNALATTHREEWEGFCKSLGSQSFVNSYRARLQVRRP